ncbi:peptide-methionine (S)-S-oxide reductase [Patescibacteria group bacterium]|nr:MAG: peptide-methionine (S)-S-oxide reductase [Patescibacteria group bacterium]
MAKDTATAVFGGGCFWCTEAIFNELRGVTSVISGYAGGKKDDPTYDQVSMGNTGHAEVVQVAFDPAVISYDTLLEVFFATHDPTTMNRQGGDVGTQYRSVIFTTNDAQAAAARAYIAKLEAGEHAGKNIVTEILPLVRFSTAEEYHQKYFEKNADSNPYCSVVIVPKLKKLREKFAPLLKG